MDVPKYDILLMTVRSNGAKDPTNTTQALTAIFFRDIDGNGNIKQVANEKVDFNHWPIAAPQPIWDDTANDVKIATQAIRNRDKTDYNDVVYCTFTRNAQITYKSGVMITNNPFCSTSAVIINKQPFQAWRSGFDWDSVGNHVVIACHSSDWNTSQKWSWTPDGMVQSWWGPTLLAVNSQQVYLGCLPQGNDPNTLQLRSGNPADITSACFNKGNGSPYDWNSFSYTASGHTFQASPVMLLSGSDDTLRLHVLLQTGPKDPHPNNVWYFWVKINRSTNWPKTKNGSLTELDAQGAGYVDTRGTSVFSQPAGVVMTTTSGKNLLYLFTQDSSGDLHVFTKPVDKENEAWQTPSWPKPINVGKLKWPIGGLGACVIPSGWLSA